MIADPSMQIPANASATGCPTYAEAKLPWAASPDLRHLRRHLDRVGFEPATVIARSAHHEGRRPIEHPVERAEQGLVHHEELVPRTRRHVACGNHGVGPLLLVATADYVEEEVDARSVENTPSDSSAIRRDGLASVGASQPLSSRRRARRRSRLPPWCHGERGSMPVDACRKVTLFSQNEITYRHPLI